MVSCTTSYIPAMSLRMLTYYARLVGCTLDSLVGGLEPDYSETAPDRQLYLIDALTFLFL